MALPTTFQERLQQMEEARNERLSLLQAERELQIKKSEILSAKLFNLRVAEQRCLLLEKRSAELKFQILARKSEIGALDARYQKDADMFRALKGEIEEVEEGEKERDRFYELKTMEMEGFKEQVRRCVWDARLKVQSMMDSISELQSVLRELQGSDGYLNNSEIAAAETRNTELLATKESLGKTLASNYQLKLLLEKQLQKTLISERTKTHGHRVVGGSVENRTV